MLATRGLVRESAHQAAEARLERAIEALFTHEAPRRSAPAAAARRREAVLLDRAS